MCSLKSLKPANLVGYVEKIFPDFSSENIRPIFGTFYLDHIVSVATWLKICAYLKEVYVHVHITTQPFSTPTSQG